MRLTVSWRQRPPPGTPRVLEVVTPRTNAASLTSAENLFAASALAEPFSVEIAASSDRRQFLVRASSERMIHQLHSQLGAAYPQADLRPLQASADPADRRADEQVVACRLELRAAAYLPIRSFTDLDVDAERAAQADPVLGLLSALGDLPAGWRGLSQVVLQPAPEHWCRDYLRLAVQHPLEHERVPRSTDSTLPVFAFVATVLAIAAVAIQGLVLLRAAQWLQLGGLVGAVLSGLVLGIPGLRRLCRTTVYDMDLVREKVTRVAYRAEVRLAVFAPASAARAELRTQLERVAAAYRRYNLAAANGFVPRRLALSEGDRLSRPLPLGARRRLAILTTRELAGVWHLPHAAADVALLERTTARRWLPLPTSVADGCRIGVSMHHGRTVPVNVPSDVLRRHLLMVAKTRRGKSTLMLRLAEHCMQADPPRSVLLVDPHRDLAEAMLGLVPRKRSGDVVFLDVADARRPFGLNLLDTGLGWDRDRAVANALSVFQHEWGERFWGPRMEDAFRFALLSLFEANLSISARAESDTAGGGRAAQHTLLEVPTILTDVAFRRQVLNQVSDPSVRAWWSDYFEPLDHRFQLELINPVLTKIHRFDGHAVARAIVGQPQSTITPSAWLRDRAIVIVNTARGTVGENASALIGSTLLNLVTLAVAEQARLERGARWPMSIFVDEFHTIPGADYEAILAELSKYGANLVLATQSLARLLAIGQETGRGLRATVFANLDGLFAFNCSAEDAEYLVPELGGALDEQDLVELGEHQCYVRLSSAGERVPTFSVQLDPPLQVDAEYGLGLAAASAQHYGRDVALVEEDRRSALARVLSARAARAAPQPGPLAQPASIPRNQHRLRKKRRVPSAGGADDPHAGAPVTHMS